MENFLEKLKALSKDEILHRLKGIDRGTWMRLLLVMIFLLVLSIFFFYPAWITRLTVRFAISNLESQVNSSKHLVSQEKQLTATREQIAKQKEGIRTRLYNPGESSQLLAIISRIAQDSKITIVASDPRTAEPFPAPWDQKYAPVAYGLTLEGGYHNLALFISKIESDQRLLRLQSFFMKPQEKNPEKSIVEIVLLGVVKK